MNPKTKILVASAVLLLLGVAASASGLDSALLARVVIGALALVGCAWWWVKARHARPASEPPRLQVIARTGLSQRTGLALVEVDGKALLVVHGDGFAEIHPPGRAPARKRRTFKAALRSVS